MEVPMSRSWQGPSRPRDERLSALLAEMTLEEKVAQLGSARIGFNVEANLATSQQLAAPFEDLERAGGLTSSSSTTAIGWPRSPGR